MTHSCELPNPNLYKFEGAVVCSAEPDEADQQLPLTADNLLLRGCTLRKTDWVVGVVVYTGLDSKIMMNRTPSKRKVRLVVVTPSLHHRLVILVLAGSFLRRCSPSRVVLLFLAISVCGTFVHGSRVSQPRCITRSSRGFHELHVYAAATLL